MKVGTDGVLLGAWAAVGNSQTILEIGTGTGLIALMLAQRSHAEIDTVELDLAAYDQALENIANSPWSDQIHIHHCAIQDYPQTGQKFYDLIVTNPPFFKDIFKSPDPGRCLARHGDRLSQDDLLKTAKSWLNSSGRLIVIYPIELAQQFLQKVEALGFFYLKKLWVIPVEHQPAKRILLELGQVRTLSEEISITIRLDQPINQHIYTHEFMTLTEDFYLKF
ncbi:MAG: methyltransferase [Oscillatoriales cyanobacterium RM1_1_9]|nr:methyltransferase [Oscillatoriales cyanobacterium RM1_1_9]